MMVSTNFMNHLNPGALIFLSALLKTFWWDIAFHKKSENIKSNDLRIIFMCVCEEVTLLSNSISEILQKLCCLRDTTNLAKIFERS